MNKFAIILAASAMISLPACGNGSGKTEITNPEDVKIEQKIALTKEQKLANTYLGNMDKLADALDNVTDEASAAKAAEAIQTLGDEMDAMKAEYGDDFGEKQMAMIVMTRQQEFMAVSQRVTGNMMRIAQTNPALLQSISKEMNDAGFQK